MKNNMENRTVQLNHLLEKQEAAFRLVYQKIWKNNTELEAYVLQTEQMNANPVLYYNKEWFEYPDLEVVRFLCHLYEKYAKNVEASDFLNKEYVLAHIKPRLVSENNYPQLEEKRIFAIPFEDMLILFYIELSSESYYTMEEQASIAVTDTLLKTLELSGQEVYLSAVHNLEKEAQIIPMDVGTLPYNIYICTTTDNVHGAATMLCKSVLKELEEKMEGKTVAILPCNVHEFLALPLGKSRDCQSLEEIVKKVNMTEVDPEDKLTDSVYIIKNHKIALERL